MGKRVQGYLKHGRDHEEDARAMFEEIRDAPSTGMLNAWADASLKLPGLLVSSASGHHCLAASPDGLRSMPDGRLAVLEYDAGYSATPPVPCPTTRCAPTQVQMPCGESEKSELRGPCAAGIRLQAWFFLA